MPIMPLPQFEADLEEDRKAYAALKVPDTLVVRFGVLKMIGEFPNHAGVKPGCGSKLVVRTHRGIEMGEMLTTTCPNSGCGKSVSRKEMLQYIDNSGGKDYPFSNQGRVIRIANADDLNEQRRIEGGAREMLMKAREIAGHLKLDIKVVDAEPLLGRDRLTFYFNSENRVDFRDMVSQLAAIYHTRIEMRQIGARDEARITADYERCGQHCCCKQFLKVLKPISMRSAKVQKATLDPLKISGRCGRLMCCLRYEDETYEELRKRLPKKKTRVCTPDGPGLVVDSQILTQLVLVALEEEPREVAVPLEELTDPAEWDRAKAERAAAPPPAPPHRSRPQDHAARSQQPPKSGGTQADSGERRQRAPDERRDRRPREDRSRDRGPGRPVDQPQPTRAPAPMNDMAPEAPSDQTEGPAPGDAGLAGQERTGRRRRRRRGRGRGGRDRDGQSGPSSDPPASGPPHSSSGDSDGPAA